MARFLHSVDSFTFRKRPKWHLAFSWLFGLGAGGLVFRCSGEHISSLMPLAAAGQLSIVSLLLSTSLPFLLSAFAVHISKPRLLLAVCFSKAFCYGYVVCGVFGFFGARGWLLRCLLLFTDTFACVLLYGFASRHISGLRHFRLRSLALCEILLGFLVYLDYSHVSPLLRRLLS